MAFKPRRGVSGRAKQLAFVMSDEVYRTVQDLAKKNNVSAAEFLRQCVEYALANMEEE